ncbi:MAG: hypothetical protein BMS9Abin01_1970 [Gammaproteobacteria bacterium]|nr:MAG: hypothetical protein BMS9Abin01_1970 [Gammaproteobacteria bacterium]
MQRIPGAVPPPGFFSPPVRRYLASSPLLGGGVEEDAGADLGLRLVRSRALGSLRIEKSFPSWGAELLPDYSPFYAGLGRFVKPDKPDFVGRDAALRLAQQEPEYRLSLLSVDAANADAWGGEPVLRDGEYVGYVSSAAFGHCAGMSLALAYLKADAAGAQEGLSVEIIGEARPVRVLPAPAVDPKGERMRGQVKWGRINWGQIYFPIGRVPANGKIDLSPINPSPFNLCHSREWHSATNATMRELTIFP